MPNAVNFAPQSHGGLELHNLYAEQGIQHTQFIIQHFRAHTLTAPILTTLIETFQLQAGISGSATTNTIDIPYVDAPWLNSTRQFLREINGAEYAGVWSNGSKHGHGQLTVKGQSIYTGEWANSKKHDVARVDDRLVVGGNLHGRKLTC